MQIPTLVLAVLAGLAGFAAGRETGSPPGSAGPTFANGHVGSRATGSFRTPNGAKEAGEVDETAAINSSTDADDIAALDGTRGAATTYPDGADMPGASDDLDAQSDADVARASDDIEADNAFADAGEDIGVLLADAERSFQEARHTRCAITGRVTDEWTGEPVIGATIIASSPATSSSLPVAITDEHGDYELIDMAPGVYTLTFYYNDTTDVRDGVSVSTLDVTYVPEELDTSRVPDELVSSYIVEDQ